MRSRGLSWPRYCNATTHSAVLPRAAGRLHGPDDAEVEPREVDVGRRAIARTSDYWFAHGCGSRVDCVLVAAGDRRIMCSAQPATPDTRPSERGAALPNVRPVTVVDRRCRRSRRCLTETKRHPTAPRGSSRCASLPLLGAVPIRSKRSPAQPIVSGGLTPS